MSNSWIITQTVDLAQGIDGIKVWPKALLVTGDENAHTWRVEIMDKGRPASVSGGVMGYFVRMDGETVVAKGTLEGNVAVVTLPGECYAYEGDLQALMRLSTGSENVSLSALLFRVRSIATDAVVDPGDVVPSLEALLAQIAAMQQATKDANTATDNANNAAEKAEQAVQDISGMVDDAEKAVSDAKQAVQDAQTAVDLSESVLEDARQATSAANEAASSANLAATNANEAKTSAETAAQSANEAAGRVDESIESATSAAERANTSADAADTATGKVEAALQESTEATQAATQAAAAATTAAGDADAATEKANTAATGADEAAQKANDAADRVDTAIQAATEATEAANTAAGAANTAAEGAETATEGANTAASAATSASESASQAAQEASSAAAAANEAADRANQAAAGAGLQKKVVDVLPEIDAMADDTIYIVPSKNPDENNLHNEYIKVNDRAEPFSSSLPEHLVISDTEAQDATGAKITTLRDRTTGEAVAPRTTVEALSGTGTAGQLVGFTGDNTVGLVTPDAIPMGGSTNPVQSGGVHEALSQKADKSELAMQTNINLLDNWYFVGGGSQQGGEQFPINQRGETTYAKNGYAIDRWKREDGSNTTLTVEIVPEGVKLTTSDNTGQYWFTQRIPFKPGNTTITMSMICENISGGDINIWIGGSKIMAPIALKEGLAYKSITVTIENDGIFYTRFVLTGNNSVTIKAVKLELGSTQTLAHMEGDQWVLNDTPDYGAELLKCQRYYQTFTSEEKRPVEAEDFRPVMRIKPALNTIQIGDKTYYTADAEL